MDIDLVQLNFDQKSLVILQVIIGIMMFGIALNLQISDFLDLLKKPKELILGLFSHFLIFPLLTIALIYVMQPRASIALGLIVVASCPGGNLSNVFTNLTKGNTALSIGLTSLTTLIASITTPIYLLSLGGMIPQASEILTRVELNPIEVISGIFLILGLPLFLGIISKKNFPLFSIKAHKVLNKFSFLFLVIFIIGALVANFQIFLDNIGSIVIIVLLHNLLAFFIGFSFDKFILKDKRKGIALLFNGAIRNTALGLAIVFQFFQGLGGMAIIVAWWGVSQITLSLLVSRLLKGKVK